MHAINSVQPLRFNALIRTSTGLLIVFFLLLTCASTPIPPSPSFSDLTPLAWKRFVAYVSPDRQSKPDTVTVSWNFTGMTKQSIKAEATIDSGASRIPLPQVLQDGDNRATLRWVPGDDTVNFSYFGEKKCLIRLSDTQSAVTIESDSFTILGSLPMILHSPRGGETFSMNDTVPVKYQSNGDRISQIRVFFMHDEMETWKEIIGTTGRTDDADPPLRSFTTLFIPLAWDTLITNHPDTPVRFLLKDYNSPLPNSSIVSGDITLQP
ncbi:MAG: hypothetical protein JW913_05485 [Chitinispirillaceae bacterium]|nr:hypothetical protein [Chitinispirillaceae bacterium]